jgi:hypothetical protein
MFPENLTSTDILLYTTYGLGSIFILWVLWVILNVAKKSPEEQQSAEEAARLKKQQQKEEALARKEETRQLKEEEKLAKKNKNYKKVSPKQNIPSKAKDIGEGIFTASNIAPTTTEIVNPFISETEEEKMEESLIYNNVSISNDISPAPTPVKVEEEILPQPSMAKNDEVVENNIEPKLSQDKTNETPTAPVAPTNRFNLPF